MDDDGRTTVLVADGHERYRSGLVRAVEKHPRPRLCGVTTDGFQALSLIGSRRPEVALVDVRLAGLDGFSVCACVKRDGLSATQVVLLSAVLDESQRARARQLGAIGPLSKDASRREICEALIAAACVEPDERGLGVRAESAGQRCRSAGVT